MVGVWNRPVVAVLMAGAWAVGTMGQQKSLTVSGGKVLLPGAGATTALAVAIVDNPTMYDVYVVSASTDVAAGVQLQQSTPATGGKAAPVKELTVPAYGTLEMKPDGASMLLTGLKRPLEAGETITLTLSTHEGAELSWSAIVAEK
jgi:periplasmic copper chaperone A